MAVNMSRPGGNVGFVGAPHGSGQIPLGRMFSYNIGLRGGLAPARAYLLCLSVKERMGKNGANNSCHWEYQWLWPSDC